MEANTCRLTGIPLTEDDVQVLLEACEFTGYQVGKHRMVYLTYACNLNLNAEVVLVE